MDYEKAIQKLNEEVDRYIDVSRHSQEMAEAYAKEHNLEMAKEYISRATAANVMAQNMMGLAMEALGLYEQKRESKNKTDSSAGNTV